MKNLAKNLPNNQAKNRLWKCSALALAAVMVLSLGLSGCGSKASKEDQASAKEGVYKMEPIAGFSFEDQDNIMDICVAGDRIYVLCSRWYYEDKQGSILYLCSANLDGTDYQKQQLMDATRPLSDVESTSTDNISNAVLSEDTVYVMGMKSENLDTGYTNAYTLYAYDLQGNERGHTDIAVSTDDRNFYINAMHADGKGMVAAVYDNGDAYFTAYDANLKQTLKSERADTDDSINSFVLDRDGNIHTCLWNSDYTKQTLYTYDRNSGKKLSSADAGLDASMSPGFAGYDYTYMDGSAYYGRNFSDADDTPARKIMDFVNSDIFGYNIGLVADGGDDGKTLYCVYFDYDGDEGDETVTLNKLTYRDPADIPDKRIVTLACYYCDYSLRRRVVDFNKNSEEQRIVLKDYSVYSTEDDPTGGATKLNNEILAGNTPDIISLNNSMLSVDAYVAKGVFADIGELIDKDPELNRSDYMENVFNAFSYDGKLYQVIPSFNVSTFAAKSQFVGDTPGWTMDEANKLIEAHPDADFIGLTIGRSEFINYALAATGKRIVDETEGRCHFDSQEFMDILTMARAYPEHFEWDKVEDDYWEKQQTTYRDDTTLLMYANISDAETYIYWRYGLFGEPITFIGFPGDGQGSYIQGNNQFAIGAKSKNKEGAWQFLRTYLTKDFQASGDNYGLPTLKSALDEKFDKAMERPYYEDNGEIVYYDNTYWLGGEEVKLPTMTEEEVGQLKDFIGSVTDTGFVDTDLMSIIEEEAPSYWNGDKSVEQACEVIQSRAQIFISESR